MMKTKEELLKTIQDAASELAMLVGTEDTVQVQPLWEPKPSNFSTQLEYNTYDDREILVQYSKLLKYRHEFEPEGSAKAYEVYLAKRGGKYQRHNSGNIPSLGTILFSKAISEQLCDDLNNRRVIL